MAETEDSLVEALYLTKDLMKSLDSRITMLEDSMARVFESQEKTLEAIEHIDARVGEWDRK
jgi:uncharacterized protein (DUF488 family)